MDWAKSICCQDRPSLCEWCSCFSKPPTRNYPAENKPLAVIAAENHAEENFIEFFMRDDEGPINCSPRVAFVNNFCQKASVLPAKEQDGAVEERTIALVYDLVDIDGTFPPQIVQKAFNKDQFLRYLSGVENPMDDANEETKMNSMRPRAWPSQGERAERRFIFIPNLDGRTILDLARTASSRNLSDSIYNYLACQPSMKAVIRKAHLSTFHLALDLPYFALRLSDAPIVDLRPGVDGKTLRHCQDLSFLCAKPSLSNNKYYSCEAHFSCVISGTHNSSWEAYAFTDTYYDDLESIENYQIDPDDPDQIFEDPLRPCKSVDTAAMDPRRYFLEVCMIRTKRIAYEWRHMLDHLRRTIYDSRDYYRGTIRSTSGISSSDAELEVQNWTNDSIALIEMLLRRLRSTQIYWSVFDTQRETYFGQMDSATQSTIKRIQDTFFELEAFTKDFHDLKESCLSFANERVRYWAALHLALIKQYNDERRTNDKLQLEITKSTADLHKLQYQHAAYDMMMASTMTVLGVICLTFQSLSHQKCDHLVPVDYGAIIVRLGGFGLMARGLHLFLVHRNQLWKSIYSIAQSLF